MKKLTDDQLLDELTERFDLTRRALQDLQSLTRKLEEMNRKLQESEALKSQFLSNIRNEINNPLSAIIGLSRQIMTGQASDPAKSAGIIHAEAFSLDFQLHNIFLAAELEAGEASPALSRVDIPALIESTLEQLRHRFDEKGVAPACEIETPLVFISDAEKLQVVLANLLANAIEFSPEGATVSISARQADGRLQLTVADTGMGIAPEHHERIFDRFRQLEMGSTKSHRGHGLGLSITKAVVELLGGEVTLESELGQGARFVLVLPEPQADAPVDVIARDGNFFLFESSDETETY